jgi:hypothetical protein
MPAVGFAAGVYVLGQLLVFGVKLCDTIMARCSQYAAHLATAVLNWAGEPVSQWLTGDVEIKPHAEALNGDKSGLEVRRGWRPWFLIVAAVCLSAVGLGGQGDHSRLSCSAGILVQRPLWHTILQPGHDPHRDRTAWLGMSDSNSETSSQIIPLKARADLPIRAEISTMETTRV